MRQEKHLTMIKTYRFKIPLYKIHVTLVQATEKTDADDVRKILVKNHIGKEYIDEVADGVRRGGCNGGETYRDFRYKRVFVFFYPYESEARRAEVYSHEKRHIEDRVLEYFGINDIESAGLLAGFLGEQFYKFEKL